jgi:dTDP-4-amino-4,6-dideoxygalactose transaminase
MREEFLPFALPDIGEEEFEEIKESVMAGWITTGPKVRRFEAEFAEKVGSKHAIAVNSCTAAMHLALEAIGLQAGDEVITTPYTFAATAEVIRYFNARPVLVDILPEDFNIDVDQIESAITERTRAIIPVHIAGLAADLDAIYDIAERYHLAVIEDAAHAFPAIYNGRTIGAAPDRQKYAFPHAVAFSFYATKTITTAEGGMLTTDSNELADRVRIMALHGISKDAWKRYTAEGSWYYEIVAPGFKYNMTDIAAGMGLVQLKKAEQMWRRRSEIARQYTESFHSFASLQIPFDTPAQQHAWHLYMLRLNLDLFSIDRARFIDELKLRNIGSSVHFIPLHIHPYYRQRYDYRPDDFPVAYQQYLREISLPIFSKMSEQDTNDVIAAVKEIIDQYGR